MNYLDNNQNSWYNKSMKKALLITSLFVVSSLMLFNIAHAASFGTLGTGFGGTISNTKATEIEALESSNYKCAVVGQTITIKPVTKSPTSYFIPASVTSKTGFTTRAGQWILGLYSTPITITCVFQGYPPKTQTVSLSTVTLWGTSK